MLTEQEREYIIAVIEPFKDRVQGIQICKCLSFQLRGKVFLAILMKDEEDICFPWFNPGEMYSGLEIDRPYELWELDL